MMHTYAGRGIKAQLASLKAWKLKTNQRQQRQRTAVVVSALQQGSNTALMASHQLASLRALELSSSAAAPLVADPFAEMLCSSMDSSSDKQPDTYDDDDWFDLWTTHFFDKQLLKATSLVNMQREMEYNQVVIIGDGFCTRPFRLLWPDGTLIFLVAPAEVHERAEAILAQQSVRVQRGCLLRRINCDLQSAASFEAALQRGGFRGDRLSVWVLQGTKRLGLQVDSINSIFTDMSNLAALESIIMGDLPSASLGKETDAEPVENLLASFGMLGGAVDSPIEDLPVDERYSEALRQWKSTPWTKRQLFMAQQKRLSLAEMDTYESHVSAAEEVDEDFFGNFS